jgi:hypothetical protein
VGLVKLCAVTVKCVLNEGQEGIDVPTGPASKGQRRIEGRFFTHIMVFAISTRSRVHRFGFIVDSPHSRSEPRFRRS